MVKRQVVFLIISLSIAAFVTRTLSQTKEFSQTARQSDQKRSQQMTPEERKKEFEKRVAHQKQLMAERQLEYQQRVKDSLDGKDKRRDEFIKQILEVTDTQWKVIKPKIKEIYFLGRQSKISIGFGGGSAGGCGPDRAGR